MSDKINFKTCTFSLLLIVFIVLRIFVNTPSYYIVGDQGKYLTLANNFPKHTLDNNQLFLQHPPLFPYLIHFFSLFFEDYIAGLVVTLLASIITFFIIYKLFMMLTGNYNITFITLIFYTISYNTIFFSKIVYKESLIVMLFMLSIYFCIKGVKKNNGRYLLISGLTGALASLTTDQVVLLLPSLIIVYFLFKSEKITKTKKSIHYYAIAAILLITLAYASWIFVKFYVYVNNEYYPAGVDGIIVKTKNFGSSQLLSTLFFRESSAIVEMKRSDLTHYLFVFGYMFHILPLEMPTGINRYNVESVISIILFIKLIFYLIILILFLYGIIKSVKELFKIKKGDIDYKVYLLLIFGIFIYPITYWISSSRMVLTSIVLIGYFIALGLSSLLGNKKLKVLSVVLVFMVLFWIGFWYYENNYFIFKLKKTVGGKNLAAYVESLPEEGFMSQVGYSPNLNYLTSKRHVSMPNDSSSLDFLIGTYNISYLIYGNHYWFPFSEGEKKVVYNYKTIKYIREHPEKYKLIRVLEEDYGILDKQDKIYIHKIIS